LARPRECVSDDSTEKCDFLPDYLSYSETINCAFRPTDLDAVDLVTIILTDKIVV
jgi:hypothetical protein